MSAINEHTGDSLVSKTSAAYRDNYDKIFRKNINSSSKECNHNFVRKMDSWCLICENCGIAERSPKVLKKQMTTMKGLFE